MENLLNYLEPLNPRVKGAQYALGGNWENAVAVDLNNPSGTQIDDTVDASVAVEVFYDLNDGRQLFFGIRYSDGLKAATSPRLFLQKVLQTVVSAEKLNQEEFMGQLGEALNDDAQTYITSDIGYVELGVVDFWKSEGSLVLRKSSDEKLDEKDLASLLQSHPHLVQNAKNPIALEFAVKHPESWIGLQVSAREGDVYQTNTQALLTLANLI